MRQFDALLRQGLMDANLAQYENVLERADGREAEAEEIAVRSVEVIGQRTHRHGGRIGTASVIHQQIHHGEKRRRVDLVFVAHFGDRLIAESERYAEAAHDLQYGIAVAHQIAHPVLARISAVLISSGIIVHGRGRYFRFTTMRSPCREDTRSRMQS